MANKINKIGCQAGKTKIVDPNNFDGFNSESNISVPLEDLNISVTLKTSKRGRSVLTNEKDGKSGTRESTRPVEINFLEGSDVNGKRVLTTKFTDLTTVFDDTIINSETLGITSIDIDFNASYAPMVSINFVDVRGSSIFQNEGNLSNNNTGNKYSTFFQMPYPIFELEIKGYYGRPVSYCLHMSKFNAQTGNFEMQANFVGYTYAMFSDMLIGYLKAIPFTTIGKDFYDRINKGKGEADQVLTLVGLIRKISTINKSLERIAATSPNAKASNAVDGAKSAAPPIK